MAALLLPDSPGDIQNGPIVGWNPAAGPVPDFLWTGEIPGAMTQLIGKKGADGIGERSVMGAGAYAQRGGPEKRTVGAYTTTSDWIDGGSPGVTTRIPDNQDFTFVHHFVKWTGEGTNAVLFSFSAGVTDNAVCGIYAHAGGTSAAWGLWYGGTWQNADSLLQDNREQTVALVRHDNDLRFYQNGRPDGEVTGIATRDFTAGNDEVRWSNNNVFSQHNCEQTVYWTAVYLRALSEGELRQIHKWRHNPYAREPIALFPSATAFTAELTTPTFSTTAQSISVLADYEAALTAPSFSASPQSLSVFEAFNADLTAATFGFTTAAITVLEGFVAALTAASFNTTPNALSVLAAFTAELTAATVTFTAQALDVPTGFDADLTTASLSASAQSITVLADFNADLTAAVFSVSPQALTALEEFQADLTAGTFSMTPQSLQVLEDFIVELTAAVLTLSGNSLDVTGDEEEVRKLIRHMTFSYLNRR